MVVIPVAAAVIPEAGPVERTRREGVPVDLVAVDNMVVVGVHEIGVVVVGMVVGGSCTTRTAIADGGIGGTGVRAIGADCGGIGSRSIFATCGHGTVAGTRLTTADLGGNASGARSGPGCAAVRTEGASTSVAADSAISGGGAPGTAGIV